MQDGSPNVNGFAYESPSPPLKTSLSSLINWNVSKVVEKNPHIDLKMTIRAAQKRLEQNAHDVNAMFSQHPEERHLACALLAWQQLGHSDADSLYRYIESCQNSHCSSECKRSTNEDVCSSKHLETFAIPRCEVNNEFKYSRVSATTKCEVNNEFKCSRGVASSSFGSYSPIGPVVKLPLETKVVMRIENSNTRQPAARKKQNSQNIMEKINQACCMESGCVERLATMDASVAELRQRATRLARREAERVKLLERAEAAWRDLELGYQRRLALAEEREEDMARQITRVIEDRNNDKTNCGTLAKKLKERGEQGEKERERLTVLDKQVCERACTRLKLKDEAAREDANLAENQCKASQLDRDLQFKEEQARRKQSTLESEAESMRALTFEAERAMRSELSALKDQVSKVSKDLLAEDSETSKIKVELDELRSEKMEMVQDLEGCKLACDKRMQARGDELKKKHEQLDALKEKAMECRCKLPVDATVEVKRTASLAALCQCTPEDKILESCSCTSLRNRLLSNLLSDLFGGLQSELGNAGPDMPCQLLKCLEDKHNWDRTTVVKSNLRSFFTQLLVGELDIAIATSIEKYHAKWIGASCADEARMIPDPREEENEGWQKRAIEKEAQKLAAQLAEKMFEEKAEQLAQRAKDIVAGSGPPPCVCTNKTNEINKGDETTSKTEETALYPCMVGPPALRCTFPDSPSNFSDSPDYWPGTYNDVTQLRMEIENLKKEAIKKDDLRLFEEIAKIMQLASVPGCDDLVSNTKEDINAIIEHRRETRIQRSRENSDRVSKLTANNNKPSTVGYRKKNFDVTKNVNRNTPNLNDKQANKSYKRPGQSYAVNMCLCSQKNPNNLTQKPKNLQSAPLRQDSKTASCKQNPSTDMVSQMSSVKQTKPLLHQENGVSKISRVSTEPSCKSDCVCFHKIPSNTSIDKLLKTLTKWKYDLTDSLKISDKINAKYNIKNKFSIYTTVKQPKLKTSSKLCMPKDSDNATHLNNQIEEKVTDFESRQPTATESEYMGAVNLEKSNENFCKCVTQGKDNIDIIKGIEIFNSNIPVKCINSCTCFNNRNTDVNDKTGEIQRLNNEPEIKRDGATPQELLFQNHKQLVIADSQKLNYNSEDYSCEIKKTVCSPINPTSPTSVKEFHKEVSSFNVEVSSLNSCQNKTNIDREQNTPSPLNTTHNVQTSDISCDSGYHIEFLGVTLTNTNIKENLKKGESRNKNINVAQNCAEFKEKPSSIINLQANKSKNLNMKRSQSRQPTSCQCNVKFDDLKNFFGKAINKQYGDYNRNEDKALDIQSFQDVEQEGQEHCVCCSDVNNQEPIDLEVNAFHLLEEHLKQKVEELKLNCSSSCIQPDEENKVFSVLLQKIKKIITESTKQVTCKCSEQHQIEGSWNRAYNLLQEYLKAKINRVKCMCNTSKGSKDTILPEIMEKVTNLIDKDFQRLQKICKCQNNHNSVQAYELDKGARFQIPEKDINLNKLLESISTSIIGESKNTNTSKGNSNATLLVTENISSQVPQNFGMETRSCDPMKTHNKCMKTIEIQPVLSNNYPHESQSCDCRSLFTKVLNESCLKTIEIKETILNPLLFDTKKDKETGDKAQKEAENDSKLEVFEDSTKGCLELWQSKDDNELKKKVVESDLVILNQNVEQISPLPYVGYTVDCTCDYNLGNCVCTKSIVQENSAKIKSMWNTYIEYKSNNQNVSYIMDNINKKNNNVSLKMVDHLHIDNINKIEDKVEAKNILCDSETSAPVTSELVLKISELRNNKAPKDIMTDTIEEEIMNVPTEYNLNNPLEWYECRSQSTDGSRVGKLKSVHFPIDQEMKPIRSEAFTNNVIKTALSRDCDCNVVPICHVKMLMENIENKLVHSECICDSLDSKVCPIHSKRSMC